MNNNRFYSMDDLCSLSDAELDQLADSGAISSGRSAEVRMAKLQRDDPHREKAMLALLDHGRFDPEQLAARMPRKPRELSLQQMRDLDDRTLEKMCDAGEIGLPDLLAARLAKTQRPDDEAAMALLSNPDVEIEGESWSERVSRLASRHMS